MIQSNVLARVPGCKRTEMIPYIRKIDLMSSNSYILSGEEQIGLIDPGALDDQWDHLVQSILPLIDERPRPFVIYLTHTHLDHCYQLCRCRQDNELGPVAVAVQEKGAEALEAQDGRLTLSELLGMHQFQLSPDIQLLSAEDIFSGGVRSLKLEGMVFNYKTLKTNMAKGADLISQQVPLGGGDLMEIYPIPGHSPDSICIRVGGILFLGDLFFAPNPGTAGAYGWSQPDLLASIERVLWILDQKEIALCYSGHGRAIDADLARRTLKSMYRDSLLLSEIEEVNSFWARNTAAYAEDLMSELERLFIIITGRLAYTSHVLDMIDEGRESDRLKLLIDAREIDGLFEQFHEFVIQLRIGRRLDWELVHKAGRMVGKLDLLLEDGKIKPAVNQSLLKRARRMLSDYSVTYRGFRPSFFASFVDINSILRDILETVELKPYDQAAIIEALDHETYIKELRARIDNIDLFEMASLQLNESQGLPEVRLDKERFVEVMTDLLERLSGRDPGGVLIESMQADDLVRLRIAPVKDVGFDSALLGHLRFFERAFSLCGAFIEVDGDGKRQIVTIDLLPGRMFDED